MIYNTDPKTKVVNGGYPTPEKIYSEKYQCWLTKSEAYFDASQNSWVNEKIEKINTFVK